MLDVVLIVLLIGLVALLLFGVVTGSWSGTWAGSGQSPEGRRIPGGPTHPSPRTIRGTYGADLSPARQPPSRLSQRSKPRADEQADPTAPPDAPDATRPTKSIAPARTRPGWTARSAT